MGANAVTTVPVYTAGEVLTAADLNITNSGIPVFADSTARTAAFGGTGEKVLAEGQYAYLESDNKTYFYDGSSWQAVAGGKVAQLVTTFKSDTFTMSTATFTDVTGLTVSITPTLATSTIYIVAAVNVCQSVGANNMFVRLARGGTGIGLGGTAGSRTPAGYAVASASADYPLMCTLSFLDSPATTSATTYSVQVRTNSGTNAVYVNRGSTYVDAAGTASLSSTITVMEILA
jgi:hypothetical protein